jgi:hypothetical protein
MANRGPKQIAWITAFVILAGGAGLYSVSLLVALASDGTTWHRYIRLFRDGQEIGLLISGVGVLSIAVVSLSLYIASIINNLNHGANVGGTGAMSSPSRSNPDAWRSYKHNRIVLLVLVLGWIPALSILDSAREYLTLSIALEKHLMDLLMYLWLAALIIEGYRLAVWPCPNCGRSFRGLLPFLPKQCRYCSHRR